MRRLLLLRGPWALGCADAGHMRARPDDSVRFPSRMDLRPPWFHDTRHSPGAVRLPPLAPPPGRPRPPLRGRRDAPADETLKAARGKRPAAAARGGPPTLLALDRDRDVLRDLGRHADPAMGARVELHSRDDDLLPPSRDRRREWRRRERDRLRPHLYMLDHHPTPESERGPGRGWTEDLGCAELLLARRRPEWHREYGHDLVHRPDDPSPLPPDCLSTRLRHADPELPTVAEMGHDVVSDHARRAASPRRRVGTWSSDSLMPAFGSWHDGGRCFSGRGSRRSNAALKDLPGTILTPT